MRTAFVNTLIEEAAHNERIWLLTGDLGFSVLEPFIERFPRRYINAGVAEQNMMGVAAGLALSGKIVFIYSIANFPTLRCLEQIRNDVCGHKLPVKIVAIGGGFSYGSHGYSHHGIEDIAIMRSLPGMEIMVPADPSEARVLTRLTARSEGPSYLRLGRGREPAIHASDPNMDRGKLIRIRQGQRIAIFAAGPILTDCLKARDIAGIQCGITPAVFSAPWVKPVDISDIKDAANRYDGILTVEEARSSGGMGGAVAEILAELPLPRARLKKLGAPDSILEKTHDQDESRSLIGISPEGIADALKQLIEDLSSKTHPHSETPGTLLA